MNEWAKKVEVLWKFRSHLSSRHRLPSTENEVAARQWLNIFSRKNVRKKNNRNWWWTGYCWWLSERYSKIYEFYGGGKRSGKSWIKKKRSKGDNNEEVVRIKINCLIISSYPSSHLMMIMMTRMRSELCNIILIKTIVYSPTLRFIFCSLLLCWEIWLFLNGEGHHFTKIKRSNRTALTIIVDCIIKIRRREKDRESTRKVFLHLIIVLFFVLSFSEVHRDFILSWARDQMS